MWYEEVKEKEEDREVRQMEEEVQKIVREEKEL